MTAPSHNPAPRWTRDQIRAARLAPILPLLQRRGLEFRERDAGNFEAVEYPGLIVKASYWRWPQRDLGGNAIDFCMKVLGLSFHDAMREITRT
jgi:hypothetical protein